MNNAMTIPRLLRFPDRASFYEARGGVRSPELDYGVHNHNDLAGRDTIGTLMAAPCYRVTFVETTGDFYALAFGPPVARHVILLGTVGPGHDDAKVHEHLHDWAEGDGPGRPFRWFIERIESFRVQHDSPLSKVVKFDNIGRFYEERGGGFSGESDYGKYNRDDLAVGLLAPTTTPGGLVFVPFGEPDHRVSHVHDTGDFYAVEGRVGDTGQVALLGSVGAGHDDAKVHEHLHDWAEGDGPGRPFRWFIERIESFRVQHDSPLSKVVKFDNIGRFYEERGGGFSGESDYGKYNRDDLAVGLLAPTTTPGGLVFVPFGEPDHRVSHVHDTGDFYAVEGRVDDTGQVALLGSVGAGHPEPEVYAHFGDWAEGAGPGRPFSWFVERIDSFRCAKPEHKEAT